MGRWTTGKRQCFFCSILCDEIGFCRADSSTSPKSGQISKLVITDKCQIRVGFARFLIVFGMTRRDERSPQGPKRRFANRFLLFAPRDRELAQMRLDLRGQFLNLF